MVDPTIPGVSLMQTTDEAHGQRAAIFSSMFVS